MPDEFTDEDKANLARYIEFCEHIGARPLPPAALFKAVQDLKVGPEIVLFEWPVEGEDRSQLQGYNLETQKIMQYGWILKGDEVG